MTRTVTDLSERVEHVSTLARKTDAALNGTMFNEESEDRQVWARKADRAVHVPLLDTAYGRRGAA